MRRRCLHILLILVLMPATAMAAVMALDGDTVIDKAGRQIQVDTAFMRIISLYGAHTENLFAIKAQDRLMGVSAHADWPAAARRKPVFSYHDGLEKFLAARPDLVLIRPMIDRGYARLVEQLERNGIVVISLQPGNVDQMRVYWRILGRLAGRDEQASAMVERFDRAVVDIRRALSDLTPRKRVYFNAIHRRMKTFAPGAMAIFALETAGGINLAADAEPVRQTNIAAYGKERILAIGSQMDVMLVQTGPMNRVRPDDIRHEPGFNTLRAVRNGQIFMIDEALVSRPTPRLMEGICRIGHLLYGDRFDRRTGQVCGTTTN